MKDHKLLGHIAALLTITIWGTTFISTKVLLKAFTPEEILWYRFFSAFIILVCMAPKNIRILSYKDELLFLALGTTGVALYYWMENLALKYTSASNVGLIVSAIPLFTALIFQFVRKEKRFSIRLLAGSLTALVGIGVIVYQGSAVQLNPIGDFFAVIAAVVFSIYSILIQKVQAKHSQLLIVTKTFFYGILVIFPIFIISGASRNLTNRLSASVIGNMLFLVIFASLACFLMWNQSIKILGSVRTTAYIYFVPLITMCASVLFLKENLNGAILAGGGLILAGVYINDQGRIKKDSLSKEILEMENV